MYQFGDFTLDAGRRELRRADRLVAVEPQVFDVLKTLIDARDRVVSREELLAVVWHGRIVSEATISSRLNAARAAIGDTGADQRLIRTLPRKGLRFVGQVREVAPAVPAAPAETIPAGGIDGHGHRHIPTVAVLPFNNMSDDPEQDYFAEGMAEEIITALSRSSILSVIARNSSFTYKGQAVDVRVVGHDLGADYVLEGSVRRSRERLRITGQLVAAPSGIHVWSDRFEGTLEDVFDLQDRVAESVSAAIEPALQSAEIRRIRHNPPAQLDAYDRLLRAYGSMAEFTAAGMDTALEYLDQALAIDPGYAAAMAAAAYCRAQCDFQGWARQDDAHRAGAVKLAWRAAELAPSSAEVLWMAAFAIWAMEKTRRHSARAMFRRALLINPNSATALTLAGWVETMCGNQGVGRGMAVRAQQLNPRDPRAWLTSGVLALASLVDEDYANAVTWAERALAQNRHFAVALRVLAVSHVKLGELGQAKKDVQELLALEPDLTVSDFLARTPFPLMRMAETYAKALKAAGLPC
jgi:TolB-like protein